jgi:hypothetical protein
MGSEQKAMGGLEAARESPPGAFGGESDGMGSLSIAIQSESDPMGGG